MRTFCLALLLFVVSAHGKEAITNIHINETKKATRVQIAISQRTNYNVFSISNPDRLVIDIANSTLNTKIPKLGAQSTVRAIRHAKRKDGVRIVLDVNGLDDYSFFSLAPSEHSSDQLIILIQKTKAQRSQTPINKSNSHRLTIKKRTTTTGAVVVAIDPGHGGKDSGAVFGRYKEKAITLALAKKVAIRINAMPRMKAVLIRSTDIFIPLQKRVIKAQQQQADMLVSIHANSFLQDKRIGGAIVFALSRKGASSSISRLLSEKENTSASNILQSTRLNSALQSKNKAVSSLLADLSVKASVDQSVALGDAILSQLKTHARIHSKEVEFGNFLVLKSYDIPAVLLEIGFMSNAKDLKNLQSSTYTKRLARLIANGIYNYAQKSSLLKAKLQQKFINYRVKKGDSLSTIALRFKYSVADLQKWNDLQSTKIKIGDTLRIAQ